MQLNKAMKRIIPPDALAADGSALPMLAPGQQPLQPWDKMRYMWRGTARCVKQCTMSVSWFCRKGLMVFATLIEAPSPNCEMCKCVQMCK
jgi:hypothetical protein